MPHPVWPHPLLPLLQQILDTWTYETACYGIEAETARGCRCKPWSRKAVCWCLSGICLKMDPYGAVARAVAETLRLRGETKTIWTYHDNYGHASSVALVQETMARLGGTTHG